MKSKIKLSKDIEFLRPFIESAKSLIPLHKVKAIKTYKVNKRYMSRTYGATMESRQVYVITLRAAHWVPKDKGYTVETLSMMLDTLAHELAHVKYFDHSYKHFRLQMLILLKFSDILKKLGIKDTSCRFNNLDTTKSLRRNKIEKSSRT